MAQYGKADYWDERYTRDSEPFDWYQRWAGLKDVTKEFFDPKSKVLVLGCGNSRLSEDLYNHGVENVCNIDISSVVIKAMEEKYADKPTMTWSVEDCRKLDQPSEAYDVVVDKGTLDALLCGEDSSEQAQKTLSETARVLKSDGTYICVSHGQPAYRLSYLQRPEYGWEVQTVTVPKPSIGMAMTETDEKDSVHHVYICTKSSDKPKIPPPAAAPVALPEAIAEKAAA